MGRNKTRLERISDRQLRLARVLPTPQRRLSVSPLSYELVASELSETAPRRFPQMTFAKRKKTLLLKAMELSVLCDCDVALARALPPTPTRVAWSLPPRVALAHGHG